MTKRLETGATRHPKGRSVIPDSPEVVAAWIEGKPEGARFTMILEDEKKARTRGENDNEGNQDGFYFGKMNKILREEIWQTKSKEEAYIRTLEYTSYRLVRNPKGGAPLKILIHVSEMDRDQMAKHIEDVQIWAAQEHGVFIPDPDPTKSARWASTFKTRGYANQTLEEP